MVTCNAKKMLGSLASLKHACTEGGFTGEAHTLMWGAGSPRGGACQQRRSTRAACAPLPDCRMRHSWTPCGCSGAQRTACRPLPVAVLSSTCTHACYRQHMGPRHHRMRSNPQLDRICLLPRLGWTGLEAHRVVPHGARSTDGGRCLQGMQGSKGRAGLKRAELGRTRPQR